MRYAAELEGASNRSLPPVEKWNPDFCGDLNLVIKRDGTWFYEGGPIGRAKLVRLFSTVLKKEDEKYFLVTPVEKLGISVEDAPFVAVLMRRVGEGRDQKLIFTTNVGDEAIAGSDHTLDFRHNDQTGDAAPYLHIRAGLEALVARAVFYDLVELCETHQIEGEECFGIWSDGVFFPFGQASDVFT